MPRPVLVTKGIFGHDGLVAASRRAEKAARIEVDLALKEAVEPARLLAVQRFSLVDARSAATFYTAVRQRGVAIRQRRRKTTGRHPEYGHKQQTTIERAVEERLPQIERGIEHAADRIAHHFET